MTSLDIYRPAAQKQLEILGNDNQIKTVKNVVNKEI